ncbi:MAG TPA: DUF3341 domain-containing protein [Candidatus Paceibacterota bacterium]|nr:DUF3341 domain-containing protein [Verrucomicrobiota bacterium]HRY49664.1 DUF3341 domain-containing protein [Candidatus Paceibacterota bacterium]HSA02649.1 DUF3341 domain-containing protein [Candidatus Paceibacterota bacterium]
MSAPAAIYGVLAEFQTPAAVKTAAEQFRDAGYTHWDVFTPCPIHGMDDAMGLRPSRVGWFAFLGGCAGFTCGMLMIWFMNAFDFPIPVGGKPLFSPLFALPISYELTILFGAFGSIIGMLLLNRLPRWHHPLLKHPRFRQATHDRFFIVVETRDPRYADPLTRRILESSGSTHIELVEE